MCSRAARARTNRAVDLGAGRAIATRRTVRIRGHADTGAILPTRTRHRVARGASTRAIVVNRARGGGAGTIRTIVARRARQRDAQPSGWAVKRRRTWWVGGEACHGTQRANGTLGDFGAARIGTEVSGGARRGRRLAGGRTRVAWTPSAQTNRRYAPTHIHPPTNPRHTTHDTRHTCAQQPQEPPQ